jgi:hypothetical protein
VAAVYDASTATNLLSTISSVFTTYAYANESISFATNIWILSTTSINIWTAGATNTNANPNACTTATSANAITTSSRF